MFMNKQLLIITTSCLLLGCAEPRSNMTTNKIDANSPKSKTENVKYTCSRNTFLSVNFTHSMDKKGQNLAIINGVGKQSIILPNKAVTSGFLYTNGKYTLRSKGQQVTWTIGRMTPYQCSIVDKVLVQNDEK
jgi:membrane-bound inhibitor of C-type lysozyme